MLVDLLHLARSLGRSPASVAAAILTLSLTLGVGTSIFAIVHAVLLTPPPFEDPDALALVGETPVDDPAAAPRSVSYATLEAWRERVAGMATLEGFDGTNLTLTGLGAAERVSVTDVTPTFLNLLGITPARGRPFEPRDAGQPLAIVSDAFWHARLAADPNVIGRQIVLGDQPHTIVGVLPKGIVFELNQSDVWRPIPLAPAEAVRAGYTVRVVARLGANTSASSLAVALDDVSRRNLPAARVVATPLATAISGDSANTLGVLGAATGFAILIAFVNFGGLLIVRSIDRRRELAIRSALGASRSEIARQLLLESQALVAAGTLAGVAVAVWISPLVGRLTLEQFGAVAQREIAVSWPVIAAVAAVASVCGWICALLPAFMTARWNVVELLRRGTTAPPRELIMRRVLVTGEVALAFVLLTCVMLLGGNLVRLLQANPGFDPRGVLALQVSLPAASYGADRVVSFYSALQDALDERLGPRSTAIVNEIPLTGDGGRTLVSRQGSDSGREAVVREASPSYFDVMRIPVLAGRPFDRNDNASAAPRVAISESLARVLFASERPIGRRVRLGTGARTAEIIAVVGDVAHRSLDESLVPTLYLPAFQSPSRSNVVVVRSGRPDADAIDVVRQEVARLDRDIPVYRVRSMTDVVAGSRGVPERHVVTAAFMGFAVLALVLGAVGLFGAVAHDVAARRGELALRIALGADPRHIVATTLKSGATMVASGLAAGGLLSILAANALRNAGFAADRLDTLSAFLPAAVLVLAGAGAILPAARRAGRTDPLIAMRSE